MAYTQKQIDEKFSYIVKEIETGRSLRSILKENEMPGSETFFKWINEDETKTKQYARSCELRAESLFEEILEIADETAYDFVENDKGQLVTNHEAINRSRLRVDARKWMLAKMQPKKYGEQIDVTTKGDKIGQYSDWTPEQIQAELKRLNG